MPEDVQVYISLDYVSKKEMEPKLATFVAHISTSFPIGIELWQK